MVREIWEDSKRHKDDSEVNHRIVEVVKEGKITDVRLTQFTVPIW